MPIFKSAIDFSRYSLYNFKRYGAKARFVVEVFIFMEKQKLSFSACDIVLPKCEDLSKWAVIACDQHTSDVSYWDEVESYVGGAPSAYNMILPEAYLGSDKEPLHAAKIPCQMKAIAEGGSVVYKNSLIFVERTLPGGSVRYGIIGAIDLESYDFSGEKSVIRPTEGTVADRVPPRVAVRRKARYEMPHVMLFVDDKRALFELGKELCDGKAPLYDFDLMLGGGHVRGTLIDGEALGVFEEKIAEIEASHAERGEMCYGVGDGNHSLAAAKSLWEEKKASGAGADDPARRALVELVSIDDDAIVFEPIYRVIKGVDETHFCKCISEALFAKCQSCEYKTIDLTCGAAALSGSVCVPGGKLLVGVLQDFIDDYIESYGGECDYIHDEATLYELSKAEGSVGILFDGMAKGELFPYVDSFGALPRKTFSMGSAATKRYYLEMRNLLSK